MLTPFAAGVIRSGCAYCGTPCPAGEAVTTAEQPAAAGASMARLEPWRANPDGSYAAETEEFRLIVSASEGSDIYGHPHWVWDHGQRPCGNDSS
jgi:hypothetical protein